MYDSHTNTLSLIRHNLLALHFRSLNLAQNPLLILEIASRILVCRHFVEESKAFLRLVIVVGQDIHVIDFLS